MESPADAAFVRSVPKHPLVRHAISPSVRELDELDDADESIPLPAARTLNLRRIRQIALENDQELYPVESLIRPRTRGECAPVRGVNPSTGALRPCPFVSCRHHLYLDVNPKNGSIKLNFGEIELEELWETCSLDVADRTALRGIEATLVEVARAMNVTRERARQIETNALAHLSSKTSTEPPPCAS